MRHLSHHTTLLSICIFVPLHVSAQTSFGQYIGLPPQPSHDQCAMAEGWFRNPPQNFSLGFKDISFSSMGLKRDHNKGSSPGEHNYYPYISFSTFTLFLHLEIKSLSNSKVCLAYIGFNLKGSDHMVL